MSIKSDMLLEHFFLLFKCMPNFYIFWLHLVSTNINRCRYLSTKYFPCFSRLEMQKDEFSFSKNFLFYAFVRLLFTLKLVFFS